MNFTQKSDQLQNVIKSGRNIAPGYLFTRPCLGCVWM